MQNPSSIVPTQDITNTKFTAVAMVLGLKLQKPGIYVTLDENHPQSTEGQAHFLFETNLSNSVLRYLQIFEAGTSDVDLQEYLSTLGLPPEKLADLEKKIAEGLISWGRKFCDQYQILARYVRYEVKRFVITGGEPVYSNVGQIVGLQNFTLTQRNPEPPKSK